MLFYLVGVTYRSLWQQTDTNRLAITSQYIARGGAEHSEKEEKGMLIALRGKGERGFLLAPAPLELALRHMEWQLPA